MKQLIMIIEDEEALIAMLKYNLEKEGFDTIRMPRSSISSATVTAFM